MVSHPGSSTGAGWGLVAALLASAALAAPGGGVGGGSAAVARLAGLGRVVACGGSHGRDVALTFDDGPGPYSALVVRILERAHARATFFLVGKELALRPWVPALERRVAVLGDHSWSHVVLPALDTHSIRRELVTTARAVERLTHAPVQLFRPPYGAHDARVDAAARSLGLLQILWSVDSRDWAGAPWYQIGATVERALRPGSIVLLHENRGQTARALRFEILPYLRTHHLRAVTIPELLAADPPSRQQLRAGLADCIGPVQRGHAPYPGGR
jgi:peptidoglycan-N-acetylglucosamine deacetylase